MLKGRKFSKTSSQITKSNVCDFFILEISEPGERKLAQGMELLKKFSQRVISCI